VNYGAIGDMNWIGVLTYVNGIGNISVLWDGLIKLDGTGDDLYDLIMRVLLLVLIILVVCIWHEWYDMTCLNDPVDMVFSNPHLS